MFHISDISDLARKKLYPVEQLEGCLKSLKTLKKSYVFLSSYIAFKNVTQWCSVKLLREFYLAD